MTTGVNNPKPLLFGLPQGVGEQIVSYLDNPKDIAALNETDKQTHQFLTYTDPQKGICSEMEVGLNRIFSKLGLECPSPDRNNNSSVRTFLNQNKWFIQKVLKRTLEVSDIVELAKNDKTDLIRQVFENTLIVPDLPWLGLSLQPYTHFSNLLNDSSITMDTRDIIYYGITSSDKCDQTKIILKNSMTIGKRALDRAVTKCDIAYINTNFDRLSPEQLSAVFAKTLQNYYQTKEEKYLNLWNRILFKNPSEDDKINALKIIAKYGDEHSFFTVLSYPSPPIDSLVEILSIAAINKNSKLLKKIIESSLFEKHEDQLLHLQWVFPAILLPDIEDGTIAHWLKKLIPSSNKPSVPQVAPKNYIPWQEPQVDPENHTSWQQILGALHRQASSLPYLLIKCNRPISLKALADLGELKPDRYLPLSPFSFPLFRPLSSQVNYTMPTAYAIDTPQQEVVPESSDLVEKALCNKNANINKNTNDVGDKLSFLSANGYVKGVRMLLDQATSNQIGKALVQAVTYRCEDVVKCILSPKELTAPPQNLIPSEDYKKCLRIAAISGFTEILQLLLSYQTNEPAVLEEALLDTLIFGHENLVTMILGKHSNISVGTLEKCLETIRNITLPTTHLKILTQMLEQIPSIQISRCQPTLLIKVLEKCILLGKGEAFSKLLPYIAPVHLKNDFSSLMQKALDSKNREIIVKLNFLQLLL